jgi:DNA mismatch endonuclease, patch repair protein
MADVVDAATRSRMMSGIKGKNTNPELVVRKLLHAYGYRFRLHASNLPGRPDIVLPKYRAIIEVRGCFWHRHKNCKYAVMPKTNRKFWETKLRSNAERDDKTARTLRKRGWQVVVIWECQTRDDQRLQRSIARVLKVLEARRGS